MHRLQNIVQRYLGASAVYGFYRGWVADYDYNRYHHKYPIKPIRYHLVTEKYCLKFCRGIITGVMYGSVGNPFAVYRFLGRAEIALMNRDPYQHIELYVEWFDVTTLPPEIDSD